MLVFQTHQAKSIEHETAMRLTKSINGAEKPLGNLVGVKYEGSSGAYSFTLSIMGVKNDDDLLALQKQAKKVISGVFGKSYDVSITLSGWNSKTASTIEFMVMKIDNTKENSGSQQAKENAFR